MLNDSILVTGTKQLIQDATTAAMVIALLIGIFFLVYYSMLKSGSDDMDQKMYGKRQRNVLICVAIAELAAIIIKLFLSYYGVAA